MVEGAGATALPRLSPSRGEWREWLPQLVAGAAFLVLFAAPLSTLLRDWWNDPDAGHGLLLAPIAGYLAFKRGVVPGARAQPVVGLTMLVLAVALRYVAALAAELFTMRLALLGAACGLLVFAYGLRQLLHWWLPISLLLLSIPLPAVVLGSLALPLQFQASRIGATLLEWRYVPVRLSGNVIALPGQTLFVTEACSGLRSLAALISLGVLIGGMWLTSPVARVLLIAAAIPVAVVLNGIRVFLTGFLTYYVDPQLGTGFIHLTEGWAIFVVAFGILAAFAWVLARVEQRGRRDA